MKLTIVIGAMLLTLGACGSKPTASAKPSVSPGVETQPSVSVTTQRLHRGLLRGAIDANGQVVPDANSQAALAFATDGQISTVNVNLGDAVSKGEVLASLDPRLTSSAINQAEADVSVAQANLAKAEVRARTGGFAQAELQRQSALARVGISSTHDLQQAQSEYQNTQADVNIARAQVQQAQAELSAARTKASLLEIVAPFDGIVTQRLKNSGETVDPTMPVLGMVNPERTVIEVQLSQDQAVFVHRGNLAEISTDGLVRRAAGSVVAVSPAIAQQTGTMTVRIRPSSGSFIPGAAAKASIVVQSIASAFIVPESAVVKDPQTGATLIYIAQGQGRYRRKPVHVLLQSAGRMAISGTGLRAGQMVVTQGAYDLLPLSGGPAGS